MQVKTLILCCHAYANLLSCSNAAEKPATSFNSRDAGDYLQIGNMSCKSYGAIPIAVSYEGPEGSPKTKNA